MFLYKSYYGIKNSSFLFQRPPYPRIQSKFWNVVFWGQDANVVILQLHGVYGLYFVQSEMDFAAVASETVKFMEMYIMEAKKAWDN